MESLTAPPSDDSADATEEIFRQVICLLDQAVSVSDPDSKRIVYLSPVHERIWGRPLEELYRNESSWVESIHPGDRERVLQAALESEKTGTYDQEYRILCPNGEIRWIRDRAFPIRNSHQKVYRIAGIAEDITIGKVAAGQHEMRVCERTEELAWANVALESEISERRKTEMQLRESNQKFQKTLEELRATQQQVIQQERLEALGKMAERVAYELSNALLPMTEYAGLLAERPPLLDDRAVAFKDLRLIRSAAKDATTVIDRLQEFCRKRKATEVFQSIDLLEALAETISATQPRWHDEVSAQERQITVEQDFRPVPTIACNGREIREVLSNLIFNAVDALPEGGRIVVRAYPHGQNAVFEVQDNGIGMTEELRTRCMEPFFTTKGEHRKGLGLALAYGIVQRHRGKIEIESRPGEGALVRVLLPFPHGINAAEPQRT